MSAIESFHLFNCGINNSGNLNLLSSSSTHSILYWARLSDDFYNILEKYEIDLEFFFLFLQFRTIFFTLAMPNRVIIIQTLHYCEEKQKVGMLFS